MEGAGLRVEVDNSEGHVDNNEGMRTVGTEPVTEEQLTNQGQETRELYVIYENDPSTPVSSSGTAMILQGQPPPPIAHLERHFNPACSNHSHDLLHSRGSVTLVQESRTTRRYWSWQRWRRDVQLQITPEQIDEQYQIEGNIRYWDISAPDDYTSTIPNERNAPPAYASVMTNTCPYDLHCSSFISPMPPPTYAQTVGITEDPQETFLQLRVATVWGHQRQSAYCFTCHSNVLTDTKHFISRFTHMSAVLLCCLGCWPCCLFPYCFNYFKTTTHTCPTCRTCLGFYSIFSEED